MVGFDKCDSCQGNTSIVRYNTRQCRCRPFAGVPIDMLHMRGLRVEDLPLLRQMIVEFATFERLADYVTVTEETLARDGFGSHPRFRGLLPEWDGELAGYAIY